MVSLSKNGLPISTPLQKENIQAKKKNLSVYGNPQYYTQHKNSSPLNLGSFLQATKLFSHSAISNATL